MTTTLATITPLERPRERMLALGAAALGDAELLALILGGGHALHRAALLLGGLGGLDGLARAMPQELAEMPGIGDASATALCAAVELARRLDRLRIPYDEPMEHSADVHRYVVGALRGAPQETFLILGLDARQRVRLIREVAKGSLSSVQIHPREVFRPLVRAGGHAVILVHNHPSGEVEPSPADLELTLRLVDVGWLLGIPVLDHLIVSDYRCLSLADEGLMPPPTLLSGARGPRSRAPPGWSSDSEVADAPACGLDASGSRGRPRRRGASTPGDRRFENERGPARGPPSGEDAASSRRRDHAGRSPLRKRKRAREGPSIRR